MMRQDEPLTPEARLKGLGLRLPTLPPAAGAYVGAIQTGNLMFVAGHGPLEDGKPAFLGKVGIDLDVDEGKKASELVMLNVLATLKRTLGDLNRIEKVIKLLVLVNSPPDFTQHPAVADGASNLLVELFGPERGCHARSAIGVSSLPFDISVEIEGVFQVGTT